MISLTHILLLVLVIVIVTGPSRLPRLGRSIGDSYRNFRKAVRGESDIDVTDSVKRIKED